MYKEKNPVLKCILERRSYRKYQTRQIQDEELDVILEAGMYAPSAGGRQGPRFIVCQDYEINEALGKAKRDRIPVGKKAFVSKEQPSILDDPDIKSVFYGAPTVITIIAPINFIFSESDCSIAAQNMMLAADSIGIGRCFIGLADETFLTEIGKKIWQKWKIDEGYKAFCHVILGYPDGVEPEVKPRKEGRIIRISPEMR